MLWSRCLLACSLLPSVLGAQTVLGTNQTIFTDTDTSAYDDRLFTPFESLSSLSHAEFATLQHPLYPRHSVRIKKSDFCDGTVGLADHNRSAYTGYIDIEARHLFFYFFESRNDPAKDDVIFWTNGGPGCSSSLGLFMELGPCRVIQPGGAKYHPESWNTNANIFFIDQPIGVGFSYAEYGETVSTTEEAARDVAAFVSIFFENFSQFKNRAFHMAGESYGGRYLPVFASAVYDNNAILVEAGWTPINLTSVMIGNGITDSIGMLLSYYDMTCTSASVPPVFDISTCVFMKTTLNRCEKWMKEACIDQFDSINCGAAYSFCLNPYDLSIECDGPISETLCYPQTKYIRAFLDDPATRSLIGVDPVVPANFTSCNHDVGSYFHAAQDTLHPTKEYVGALLERGIKILIYVGNYDWICNWVGNERWTLALEWSGQAEFASKELSDWVVDGKAAGKTRSAQGLTFATIFGAGHLVPFDKPKESLALIQRWLGGEAI
ncbi:serine carboxypeptidase [Hymenopellis radicata]|nr:serine carboxypeptidase [Hymenopellis radicata]